jgi:hypothetical protein
VSGGLAEQTNDEELTGLLKAVEVEAGAKKEAQDEARAEAQRLCEEGDRLLAGFDGRIRWADSIEKSIVQYKLGAYAYFPCLALPCLALPCLALPCLALPCLALPCLVFDLNVGF